MEREDEAGKGMLGGKRNWLLLQPYNDVDDGARAHRPPRTTSFKFSKYAFFLFLPKVFLLLTCRSYKSLTG